MGSLLVFSGRLSSPAFLGSRRERGERDTRGDRNPGGQAPSPQTETQGRSGAANFAPSTPATPKPMAPKPIQPMKLSGRVWTAPGFRSPATRRAWELMPQLGFDYDSSYPDTDPYEPQAGGCCSLLPFFNRTIVELPITLPQDHTLFTILRRSGAETWIEKTEAIRDRGGMALLITHPDYMDDAALAAYRCFLERFAGAVDVWRALPREVSDWWRRRAASLPVRDERGWRVDGAAAGEATIAFAAPA